MTSEQWVNAIQTGDSLEVLKGLPENSVHAIVTDPPYGLAFMGRSWDDFEPKEYQEWCENWARRARRVLRPGGHLLAFSGNRTHHRLFSGVEDAGYEIRDTITWHYGSGFPKSLDVSKAIDKAEGAEDNREVVGEFEGGGFSGGKYANEKKANSRENSHHTEVTSPATDAAQKWQGWKTCLKPASEFVVVARNPLDRDTVAGNVREWGTGALNIGACRVGTDVDTSRANSGEIGDGVKYSEAPDPEKTTGSELEGRYPSNVVVDEAAARMLDNQSGDLSGGHHTGEDTAGYGQDGDYNGPGEYTDSGGASRYYKVIEWRESDTEWIRFHYTSKASRAERTEDGAITNDHPTVKPVDLMEWLVRLVTREGQTVLDPFAGSGTTCKAAKQLGRKFAGIERQEKYADIARVRCGLTPDDPSVVRDDDNQRGMEEWL